ncbi:hypothetical protein BD779DRAFT_1478719 [Infundibulicybe gibba]|nr:hypothetical protein BD779DRAFT_1478719 [Infundibulicybe gibba]
MGSTAVSSLTGRQEVLGITLLQPRFRDYNSKYAIYLSTSSRPRESRTSFSKIRNRSEAGAWRKRPREIAGYFLVGERGLIHAKGAERKAAAMQCQNSDIPNNSNSSKRRPGRQDDSAENTNYLQCSWTRSAPAGTIHAPRVRWCMSDGKEAEAVAPSRSMTLAAASLSQQGRKRCRADRFLCSRQMRRGAVERQQQQQGM